MKLVPVDIAHKSFSKKIMGYDENEVANFLNKVAQEMDALIREVNRLKETLREKDLQVLEYRDRDKVLKDTITATQQMSEKMVKEAEREAKLILNDANQKAEMIGRDSRDQLKTIYRDISDLKRTKMAFEANVRALIQAHLSLLENKDEFFDKDLINKIEKPFDHST